VDKNVQDQFQTIHAEYAMKRKMQDTLGYPANAQERLLMCILDAERSQPHAL
jgi:hypothetical protein